MPEFTSTNKAYLKEIADSPTLTTAYHRLYFQLTHLNVGKKATFLTPAGYRDYRRTSSGKQVTLDAPVFIQSTNLRNIVTNPDGTQDGSRGLVECKIGGKLEWVPLKYVATPGSSTFNAKGMMYAFDKTTHERNICAGIREHIEEYGREDGTIDLLIGDINTGQILMKNLYWAYQTPRGMKNEEPKADIIMYPKKNYAAFPTREGVKTREEYRASPNHHLDGNIYISLKKGIPGDKIGSGMEQWGGLTARGTDDWIANKPEVVTFESKVRKWWLALNKKKPLSALPISIWAEIKDEMLALSGIYGKDSNKSTFGYHKVHFIAEGRAIITSVGDRTKPDTMKHTITFSNHIIHFDKCLDWIKGKPYRPVIAIVKGRDKDRRSIMRASSEESLMGLTKISIPFSRYAMYPMEKVYQNEPYINITKLKVP